MRMLPSVPSSPPVAGATCYAAVLGDNWALPVDRRGVSPAACVCLVQVQGELATVDKTREQEQSFARVGFNAKCEAAINEQIKCVGGSERAVCPLPWPPRRIL